MLMTSLDTIFSKLPFAHHAYGIELSQNTLNELKGYFDNDNFSYVVSREYDSFKIDDARMIKRLQSEKTEKASVFILKFSFINKEAQNALLKVLEEPSNNTYFILVFPDKSKLLPTLQSRLYIISQIKKEILENNNFCKIKEFKEMSVDKRLELIKLKTDKKKEDTVTKSDILVFLDEFEIFESHQDASSSKLLENIIFARESIHANGASVKMILEMLAIHIS